MLKGYKTYIMAAVAVLTALAAYFTGESSVAETAQAVLTAVLAMSLRHGIANAVDGAQ